MRLSQLALVIVLLGLIPGISFGADVSGVITDTSGKPAPGIKVIAQTAAGQPIQTAVAGSKGRYAMTGLTSGNYRFALDPGSAGFKKGEPFGAFVSEKGLTLNWVVSGSADPIGLAQPGSAEQMAELDPFGLSLGEFASVVALGATVVEGGVLGGYAAAGGFSSGGGGVTSPSQ